MDEIIKIKNTSYARYEELLMRRDNLKKEAFLYERAYVREFGDLILEVFEKKIECIRKKKIIEYCQQALNYGRSIDQNQLQKYLQSEMALFQAQLEEMSEDTENAKKSEIVSEMDLLTIKRIYHKLAKCIHPDINPLTNETPELLDLWNRIQIAYNCNDLKGMQEMEFLTTTALKQLDVGTIEIEIRNIDEKIAEIEAEIEHILNTDPYRYKEILEDPDAIEDKKNSLREELRSYEEYSNQLEEILKGFLGKGVSFTWKMN